MFLFPVIGAASDPGGHTGGRTQTPPLLDVPRGHPALALAHTRRPLTTRVDVSRVQLAPAGSNEASRRQRPVERSTC
jgi:hypothetical protein